MRTTEPVGQIGARASTSSQITASTAPVVSPSWSFRKGSPLRRWRRVCPRTTKTSLTSWPSARSRTKHLEGVSVVCSMGTCQGKAGLGRFSLPVMGVLVAGGTGALGSAVVRELLDSDYDCTLTWIVDAERERSEAELGDRVNFVRADLIDPQGGADEAVAAVDDLEAVVNLVGGFFAGSAAHETAWEDFDRMLRLNLSPAINLARVAMPRMLERGGGSFVSVSARPAVRPFPGSAAYSTAKAAVLAFVRALDADYRTKGIRANAILPSVIDTPANRRAEPDADYSKWVQPIEIARVIRFLVSDDSAVTSGAAIPVYGRA